MKKRDYKNLCKKSCIKSCRRPCKKRRKKMKKSGKKIGVAVLVSGGGTNLQAMIDASKDGKIRTGKLSLVISDKPSAYALERAKKAGIKTAVVSKKDSTDRADFEAKILAKLEEAGVELLVLAGFMKILSDDFIKAFKGRIINVHPSLIPAFCGEGYYGLKVHEAALATGVKVSGATVHYVNEVVDGGEIIYQKAIRIKKKDRSPEKLQKKIMKKCEWKILPKAVEKVCKEIKKDKKN